MFVKYLKDCREFTAGDDSTLRELLHPDKMDAKIRYSLAHAKITVGRKTRPHRLQTSEVYYILSGQGLMHIDNKSFEVGPQCAVYIPPNAVQFIENTGSSELEFLCIVDPAWRQADEEILDG
ncbi:MAG: cupin domain-containing protein [Sedimentisphaerales bacterium]|nr:cupin domain-containing protein [Sedimentisphaerales bacterium]